MSDFSSYLWEIFTRFLWVMGAGPFLVDRLVNWLSPSAKQWLERHPKRQQIYLSLVLIGAFLSGFQVWKDERQKYLAADNVHSVSVATIEGGTTYQVLPEDFLLSVATSLGKQTTIKLPPEPHKGQRLDIKDANGKAGTGPIIIKGNGHNIDNGPTYTLIRSRG